MRPSSIKVLFLLALPLVSAVALWFGDAPRAESKRDPQTIYRYLNAQGRAVYVNGLARVPDEARPRAQAVDLSQASTNRELGTELKRAVDAEIERLTASGYCVRLREAARASWFAQLWKRHGHLILIGCVVLLLIGLSPWITQHIPAPQWGRVLFLALPVLALLAVWTTAVIKTTRTTQLLRTAAEPCEAASYRSLPDTPQAQRKRMSMVHKLQQQMRGLQAQRVGLIEDVLRREGNPPTHDAP